MQLLGVNICDMPRKEILTQVRNFLNEPQFHRIATVNPEFLVMADRDSAFKRSLLSADLCVVDGVGIVWAGWLQRKSITRFPGVDLLHEILLIAERDGHPVFLAVKQGGLSSYEEIRVALLKKYPGLIIGGQEIDHREFGNPLVGEAGWKLKIGNSTIALCNFGAPEQETLLESLRKVCPQTRLVIGVGGAFDFLTGKQKRAPEYLRTIGLEWLWRLILQPSRFNRIWNAAVVFPVKVLLGGWTTK
jgi:N-acetylglucosaminyldiphosphoundecaprenol N-acetyl-beta-D-mannosaminyltransferase